jgi:hypothetical protein
LFESQYRAWALRLLVNIDRGFLGLCGDVSETAGRVTWSGSAILASRADRGLDLMSYSMGYPSFVDFGFRRFGSGKLPIPMGF